MSNPCMLEKECNDNSISTFPPCYEFHMIWPLGWFSLKVAMSVIGKKLWNYCIRIIDYPMHYEAIPITGRTQSILLTSWRFFIICQIKFLNFDKMATGFLSSSIVLLFRGWSRQKKNMLKMPVLFLKLMHRLQERRERFLNVLLKYKYYFYKVKFLVVTPENSAKKIPLSWHMLISALAS